jgi:hypothetical protein
MSALDILNAWKSSGHLYLLAYAALPHLKNEARLTWGMGGRRGAPDQVMTEGASRPVRA